MTAFKVEKYSNEKLREIRKIIDRELESRNNKERKEIAKQIHDLAASVGMTPEELLASGRKARKQTSVAQKYRDPDSDKTWSGRGRKPAWVAKQLASGKSLDDLAI